MRFIFVLVYYVNFNIQEAAAYTEIFSSNFQMSMSVHPTPVLMGSAGTMLAPLCASVHLEANWILLGRFVWVSVIKILLVS